MRLATATIVASLAWTACSTGGPAGAAPIELGKPFSLRPGEMVHTSDNALRIGFTAVTADSRCPKGEQCVVAGDATVRVWLKQGAGPRQAGDLRAAPGKAQALQMFSHELRLVGLAPYPVSGKVIAAADYVATFTLSRGAPPGDPDR